MGLVQVPARVAWASTTRGGSKFWRALPEQLFYNTGIATYVWVVTNRKALQEAIRALVRVLPTTAFRDRAEFERALDAAARKADLKLPAPAHKTILSAFSERDETAAICRDQDGNPEPDPELRVTESRPAARRRRSRGRRGCSGQRARLLRPRGEAPCGGRLIETGKRDPKDGHVGVIGYEINFNRYFYRYTPPRPLEDIEADIRAIEGDIVRMLGEVTGAQAK